MTISEEKAKRLEPYRFKPGQSGNPNGRPKVPDHMRAIGIMNRTEFNCYFTKYARMKVSEIHEVLADKETTGMDAIMASAFVNAISGRSVHLFSVVLDKMIPRPKDGPDVNVQTINMSDDELYEKSKEIILVMAKQRGEVITIEGDVSSNMK